jgi:peptidoglycan hydrolase FlgJ
VANLARPPVDATQAFALDTNALAGLKRQARESPEQALSKAAGQFEALFLQMVLKQMRESLPKDGPLDSDTMRSYTAMFDQQLAQQLSSRGMGLKDAIVRQLGKRLAPPALANAEAAALAPASVKPQPLPDHAPARASGSVTSKVQSFVDSIKPHAEAAAKTLGIPAHLIIAQAGLETGWGRRQPVNADGAVSHNLFGVKAGLGWSGAAIAARTTEFVQGAAQRTVERFRAYDSYGSAFRDFARVLAGNRYADARANAADPVAYAKSLQRAGYATDPNYADKLTRAIRMVSDRLATAQEPARIADKALDRPRSLS